MIEVDALISADTVYPTVECSIPDTRSAWPIHPALARLLARMVIERDLHDILEFGAGSSSVVFAKSLSHRGTTGRLTSVEQDPSWSVAQWAIARSTRGVDARMIQSPVQFRVSPLGLYHGYSDTARVAVAARGPYSLILVDGPSGHVGRDGALHLAFPSLAPGALIVVDDSRRRKERATIARWLAVYPGLSILADASWLGRGTTVLRYNGDPTSRISARAFVSSIVREAYAWLRHLTADLPHLAAPRHREQPATE